MKTLPKLACPYCLHEITRVVDSYPSNWSQTIQRRRQCQHCRQRFTTQERIVGVYKTGPTSSRAVS